MLERTLYSQCMTSTKDLSQGDIDKRNSYSRDFWPGVVGYLVALPVTLAIVGQDPDPALRMLMILPVIPSLWIVRAVVRFLRRCDERERLIQLEAMAIGFAAAIVSTMTIGFVGLPGNATLFNQLAPWIAFTIAMLGWGLTVGVQQVRQ